MKVSGLQIFWMVLSFETGNTLLMTLRSALNLAKQDAWISYVIAGILGIWVAFVTTKLSLLYPNKTLIEYSQIILGKWSGRIIAISYMVQWYSASGAILREFADFTITILFNKTPLWVLVSAMLFLIIYSIYQGGIESIGRCSEFLGPIIMIAVIIILILNIPNLNMQRVLPIYADSGWLLILKGSLTPASYFCECVMLTTLLSFLVKPDQGPSRAMWGVGIAVIAVTVSTLSVILTFGPELSLMMMQPFFTLTRYISVMGFIQNMDVLVVLAWIFSIFIKSSLFFFMSCYGTAQLFNIKDWRKTIWFIAPIVITLAISYRVPFGLEYINKYWIPIALPINMIGIPLLLWIVGIARKKTTSN